MVSNILMFGYFLQNTEALKSYVPINFKVFEKKSIFQKFIVKIYQMFNKINKFLVISF